MNRSTLDQRTRLALLGDRQSRARRCCGRSLREGSGRADPRHREHRRRRAVHQARRPGRRRARSGRKGPGSGASKWARRADWSCMPGPPPRHSCLPRHRRSTVRYWESTTHAFLERNPHERLRRDWTVGNPRPGRGACTPPTKCSRARRCTLVGKEKIGAAYVTIMVRGDVAAVQPASPPARQRSSGWAAS